MYIPSEIQTGGWPMYGVAALSNRVTLYDHKFSIIIQFEEVHYNQFLNITHSRLISCKITALGSWLKGEIKANYHRHYMMVQNVVFSKKVS